MTIAPSQTWRVAALAMMTRENLHDLLRSDDAAAWIEAAAACAIPEAQVRLGRMLLAGEGAPKDVGGAFVCFLAASRSGDADGLNMLGRCYENGWGTRIDLEQAVDCYRRAGELGHAWAQYNLGHMLLDGAGVPRDRDEAFRWYTHAAGQGHARAMNLLGRCCEEGWGTARDATAAVDWYRRSAEGGYFRGAYNFATTLASEGCIEGAALWFSRALKWSPEPTHGHMRRTLAAHPNRRLREIALSTSPTFA